VTSCNILHLSPETFYYYRVFAYNGSGTSGSSNIDTVITVPNPLTVTTTVISAVTSTTAASGGNVTSDGGSSVTARGVCWSTSSGPTVTNTHTSDGMGTGSFTSSLTSLSPGVIYYVRAYATNAAGTGYGNELSLITVPAPPSPTAASNITQTSFTANWQASQGATGYYLDVSTSSTFASYVAGYQNWNVGNVVAANVTGLTAVRPTTTVCGPTTCTGPAETPQSFLLPIALDRSTFEIAFFFAPFIALLDPIGRKTSCHISKAIPGGRLHATQGSRDGERLRDIMVLAAELYYRRSMQQLTATSRQLSVNTNLLDLHIWLLSTA